jgi:hypothetical protein
VGINDWNINDWSCATRLTRRADAGHSETYPKPQNISPVYFLSKRRLCCPRESLPFEED